MTYNFAMHSSGDRRLRHLPPVIAAVSRREKRPVTLENWKDLATIIGVGVAAFTFVKVLFEYMEQGAQKRVERFLEMRKRFKENELFKELCSLIEHDDPKLAAVPFKDKRDLLGFFEEIAIMLNSGVMRKEVAHYMFGYYAIRCWQSVHFWQDVNVDSPYWGALQELRSSDDTDRDLGGIQESGQVQGQRISSQKIPFLINR